MDTLAANRQWLYLSLMDTDFSPRKILIVVPESGLLFEAAGIAEIFAMANQFQKNHGKPQAYHLTLASTHDHKVVRGRSGLSLIADTTIAEISPDQAWNSIIITGRGEANPYQDQLVNWVQKAAPQSHRMVSVCAGALILAKAGLLEGKRATTHWEVAEWMGKSYPEIHVDSDSIYIHDGKIWTSAGASSGFDLTLALVEEDLGHEAAKTVARRLVLYLRRPGGQSQFSSYMEHQADAPGPIRDVQAWALENLDHDLSIDQLAQKAAMSPRNFVRKFTHQTGITPGRFVEKIRLEAAQHRLEQGRETMEAIAIACGLGSALTLRRLFEKNLRITPGEYRERFGSI